MVQPQGTSGTVREPLIAGLCNGQISGSRARTFRLHAVWPAGSDSAGEEDEAAAPAETVDAVVVGAGIAGLTAAKRLQMAGALAAPWRLSVFVST